MFRTGPVPFEDLPVPFQNIIVGMEAKEPDYLQVYACDADCQAYVEERYPVFAGAYSDIVAGAFRADVWRLMVLWEFGGIYNDLGHQYTVPVADVVSADARIVLVVDSPVIMSSPRISAIHNALMAAHPRHPLMGAILQLVMSNVVHRAYGTEPLDITGPVAVGRAFDDFFDKSQTLRARHRVHSQRRHILRRWNSDAKSWEIFAVDLLDLEGGVRILCAPGPHQCLTTKINQYYELFRKMGSPHYSVLWYEGRIFRQNERLV